MGRNTGILSQVSAILIATITYVGGGGNGANLSGGGGVLEKYGLKELFWKNKQQQYSFLFFASFFSFLVDHVDMWINSSFGATRGESSYWQSM